MGTLPELISTQPLTIVEGGLIPSDVATRIASELPYSDSSAFIDDLLGAGRSAEARRQAIARRDPQLVAAVDRLRRLVQDCNTVLLKTLDRASSDWEKAERDELRADQDDAGGRQPVKSLRELDRTIVQMEAELLRLAARSLPPPLAACRNPVIDSAGDLFDQAIRTALVHRETRSLLVAFEIGGEAMLDPHNLRWLRKTLDAGCTVMLYLIPGSATLLAWDSASAAALDRIATELTHHLLKVQKGRVRIPSALVVGTSLVVIGSQAWWGAGNDDLTIAADAPHLATLLWQLAESDTA